MELLSFWLYSPLDLGRFFSFLIYTQTVGLLGRGISPSQGRYLHTDIHASSGKTVHSVHSAATAIGCRDFTAYFVRNYKS
jgi:hypothetical protein